MNQKKLLFGAVIAVIAVVAVLAFALGLNVTSNKNQNEIKIIRTVTTTTEEVVVQLDESEKSELDGQRVAQAPSSPKVGKEGSLRELVSPPAGINTYIQMSKEEKADFGFTYNLKYSGGWIGAATSHVPDEQGLQLNDLSYQIIPITENASGKTRLYLWLNYMITNHNRDKYLTSAELNLTVTLSGQNTLSTLPVIVTDTANIVPLNSQVGEAIFRYDEAERITGINPKIGKAFFEKVHVS